MTKTYDMSIACPLQGCIGASYVRMLSERTTMPIPAGANVTKKTEVTYQSHLTGLVSAVKEWKFYPGSSPSFPTVPDKATYVSYLTTGTNNINRPVSTTVCSNIGSDPSCPGGGSKVAQTTVMYDSYVGGLMSITGVTNHDDLSFGTTNTARGNQTQISQWVSGSSVLMTQFGYDTTGQVTQRTDPAGNVTAFSYVDNFFTDNGMDPPGPFAPPTPTNAYLAHVTQPIGTITHGYYYGSGKTAFSTDLNGRRIYFHFLDPLDRPTLTNSQVGWALTNYTSVTQVDTYTAVADTVPSTACSSCRHNRFIYDGLGRRSSVKLVNNPAGTVNVDTFYNSTGEVQSESHPYINAGGPDHVFESSIYDGLGRGTKTIHPDGKFSQTHYGALASVTGGLSVQQGSALTYGYGEPILTTDEAGKQKQHWLDGFGQLIEVNEPGGSTSGSGAATVNGRSVGSVNITGWEQSVEEGEWVYECVLWFEEGVCWQWDWVWHVETYWDYGRVSITVNGLTKATNYGQGSTGATIATALANAMNADVNYPVTASTAGPIVYLSSKTTGSGTNYSLSASSSTSDPARFAAPSFVPVTSGPALAGGGGAPVGTFYKYDVLGNLTQVIQGVQTRTYTYDGLSRVTSVTTPEAGTVNLFYMPVGGGLCSGDPANVCRKVDARGITTTYAYDAMNRLTGKSYSDGTPSVVYTYDQGGAPAFALGRLTQMVDGSGSETYTFDASGRALQVAKVVGGSTFVTSFQYNFTGAIARITYPSGRIVEQAYDNVGRLCVVAAQTSGCANSTGPYAADYAYSPAGNVTGFNYGNAVTASFTYSSDRLRLTSLNYAKAGQSLFRQEYWYRQDATTCPTGSAGDNGQIQCITDLVDAGRTQRYTYDSLGRLSTASTAGSTNYPQWGLAWNYDRYNNRLSQSQTAGSPPSNSLSFANPGGAQTNRPDGYSFDSAGNMLNDGNNTLVYDAENRVTSSANQFFGTHKYVYDGNNLRVRKCTPNCTSPTASTVYIFSGAMPIAEYDNGAAANAPSREYVYGRGQLLATISGGTTTYHHPDHLSVRLSTDSGGNKIGEQGHYPYGEAWYAASSTTKFFFTSYQRDGESGNDYAMARFYISRFGRFCSADPVGGSPLDPQSWNRYAYVRNDPVNMTDPSGEFWLFNVFKSIFKAIAKIFGFDFSKRLNLPKIGTPPTFPTGPGTDLHTLFFGKPDLSQVLITDWSPKAHDQIIWNALHPCGVSNADIWQIQEGSKWFDRWSQGSEWANAHSTGIGTGQSAEAANLGRNSFMHGQLMTARSQWNAGARNQAMFTFGVAMHAPMDWTSPAHTDNQGNPIPWCGMGGCGPGTQSVFEHSADGFPWWGGRERVADLNAHPELQEVNNLIIRHWYEQLTGQKLQCDQSR